MNRRNLLRYMTFGAVGAAAPVAATQAMAHKMPVKSDVKTDGPICAETFQLQSGTKKRDNIKKAEFGGLSFYGDDYVERKSVAMSVGQDGNLWLKTEDGIWKRVVTE